ncbi:unnamed protein product, partial [Tetraodon nigroviridis]
PITNMAAKSDGAPLSPRNHIQAERAPGPEPRAPRRRPAEQRYSLPDCCWTLGALLVFFSDGASDLWLAADYYLRTSYWCFALTLVFVVVPSLVVQVLSFRWFAYDFAESAESGSAAAAVYVHALYLGVQSRWHGDPERRHFYWRMTFASADISMLRLLESFLKSAPQLVLQLSIMVHTQQVLPLQGLSASASLLSLAWMVASYQKVLRDSRDDKLPMSYKAVAVQILWHLFAIGARTLAFALFASAFQLYFGIFVVAHCVREGRTRCRMLLYSLTVLVENVALTAVWYLYRGAGASESYAVVMVCVVASQYALGTFFMFVYYCLLHPDGPVSGWGYVVEKELPAEPLASPASSHPPDVVSSPPRTLQRTKGSEREPGAGVDGDVFQVRPPRGARAPVNPPTPRTEGPVIRIDLPRKKYVHALYLGVQSRWHGDPERRHFYWRMTFASADISMLRLLESFLKSAPQLVLQLSIMVHTQQKVLRDSRDDKLPMSYKAVAVQILWHLFAIGARTLAFALFASAFQLYFGIFVVAHWCVMTFWIIQGETDFCMSKWEEIVYNMMVGVVYIFCWFSVREGRTRCRMLLYSLTVLVENVALTAVWYLYRGAGASESYAVVMVCVVASSYALGTFFMFVYYCLLHPD